MLGQTPPQDMIPGPQQMAFSVRTHQQSVFFDAATQDLSRPLQATLTHAAAFRSSAAQVDAIDVSHLKRHVLANVGLLMATLYADGGQREIVQVSMVTQVTPEADGTLIRSVFSPLD